MTGAQWGILVPAIAAVLMAAAGWLRAEVANRRVSQHQASQQAHQTSTPAS